MDRRTILQRIAGAAGAAYWGGQTLAVELAQAVVERPASSIEALESLPLTHVATLAAVCELIIPATTTPGAIAAGVPAFIADMHSHWMTELERQTIQGGLTELDNTARFSHGMAFAQCSTTQQSAMYAATHAAAAAYQTRSLGTRIADPAAPFFYKLRDLVTLGYFTSESGIRGELAYVPVPGSWKGDIHIKTWNKQLQL